MARPRARVAEGQSCGREGGSAVPSQRDGWELREQGSGARGASSSYARLRAVRVSERPVQEKRQEGQLAGPAHPSHAGRGPGQCPARFWGPAAGRASWRRQAPLRTSEAPRRLEGGLGLLSCQGWAFELAKKSMKPPLTSCFSNIRMESTLLLTE